MRAGSVVRMEHDVNFGQATSQLLPLRFSATIGADQLSSWSSLMMNISSCAKIASSSTLDVAQEGGARWLQSVAL